MATLVLDAYTKAYPFITNRIMASVSLQTNPSAIIASIIDTTPGHPVRTWFFSGLQRANYQWSLDEIDSSGASVNNLALFSVVPSQVQGYLSRGDEQIMVGATIGFDTGVNTATFDGAGGKPNYIGWEITPSELTGRGILVRGTDYGWDAATGVFLLLQSGDVLQQNNHYNIHFDPKTNSQGNSVPLTADFSIRIVTTNDSALPSDFSNKVILSPSVYLEFILPSINTVPQGRKIMIEGDFSGGCSKVKPNGTDVINFVNSSVYLLSDESLAMYVFDRAGVLEWRVCEAYGNFKSVGQLVSSDDVQNSYTNKLLLDGASLDKFQYARIYNEFVLNLPSNQVCNYDDWLLFNNKYLYSFANSANPSNLDMFKIPDRRGVFERNTLPGLSAGEYFPDTFKKHGHAISTTASGASSLNNVDPVRGSLVGGLNPRSLAWASGNADDAYTIRPNGDSETRPKNYLINKYVLI